MSRSAAEYPPRPKPLAAVVAAKVEPYEVPGSLAQAVDETLDACAWAFANGKPDVGMALLTSARTVIDRLLLALKVPDPDTGPPL